MQFRQDNDDGDRANADKGQEKPICFRPACELMPGNKRKQRPYRGSKEDEGRRADKHGAEGGGAAGITQT